MWNALGMLVVMLSSNAAQAVDLGPVADWVAAQVPSHIFGTNDRVRVGDDAKWKGWIGRLVNLATGGLCTASLVGKDLILTAAHCVSKVDGSVYAPMEFQQGYEEGRMIARSAVVLFWVNRGYDFAILKLEKPLGEPGHFRVADWTFMPPWTRRRVKVAGYGRYFGASELLTAQASCTVHKFRKGRAFHDCDIDFGDSGGPVFTDHLLMGPTIVAVHTGAFTRWGQMEARRGYDESFAHYGPSFQAWGSLLKEIKDSED